MAIVYVVQSNGNIQVQELSTDVMPAGQPGWSLVQTDIGDSFFWNPSTHSWVGSGGPVVNPYIVSFGLLGSPLLNSQAIYIDFEFAVSFPANFGAISTGQSSGASGNADATGSTVFSIDKRTASPDTWGTNVGSITIGAGGVIATFATAGGISYTTAAGEKWRVIGPSTADATFANLMASLVGTH